MNSSAFVRRYNTTRPTVERQRSLSSAVAPNALSLISTSRATASNQATTAVKCIAHLSPWHDTWCPTNVQYIHRED